MKTFIIVLLAFSLSFPATGQTEAPVLRNTAGVTFSFPWVNYYRYVDYYKNTSARKFGFFGIGLSLYYKTGPNKVSFNCSTSEDLDSPAAAINYSKKDIATSIGTSIFELSWHRTVYGDFGIVGGFNFTNYAFHLTSTIASVSSYKKSDQTLGLSAGLEYRFNKHYSVAGMYRPALASFETDEKYRHVINFELRIDLDFKKRSEEVIK
ncbi:MAG: outer membrane beta-barrel protein [Bacteroidia bacterium]